MSILDVSINTKRSEGERRSGGYFLRSYTKSELWTTVVNHNPYPEMINHRKHEGQIYRKAIGGFENRGKPRYWEDMTL